MTRLDATGLGMARPIVAGQIPTELCLVKLGIAGLDATWLCLAGIGATELGMDGLGEAALGLAGVAMLGIRVLSKYYILCGKKFSILY